ncbi:MAG: adenylate/guanylate cyclase domain-containing protein [Rhodospirillaceae bacterium]|nr:adenylate/guanylate cyclase domain-containing protein [Rhodospirillaceae bacterium]MBT6402937.1 adenylate/guanylate cyclase domain-containing protein [Rhodospirillaceae bacterium]
MITRVLTTLRGGTAPVLPQRVREDVARQQDRSEQIISVVQIVIVLLFCGLFLITPGGADGDLAFELTPWALGGYLVFSVARFWASCKTRLPGWFLTLSVIADMALLMVLIWSFHRTYGQPPSFYLKAPTLLYVFIFIALRALRFDARYVLLAGFTAMVGWSLLVLYAAAFETGEMTITRNYVEYITGNTILLGAEFDKLLTIGIVTAVLAAAVLRARQMLFTAVSEGSAKRDLARFFDTYVADRITGSEHELHAGEGQHRNAAVVFFDIRGFTGLSGRLDAGGLVQLLSEYQSRIVPIVQDNGGVIDKFLGDGVMATFGAVVPNKTYAADALRAIEAAVDAIDAWNTKLVASGKPALTVNAAAASGDLIFAAVGDERRLEYTVIGDTVNLAAKLEKHTKHEEACAVVTTQTYDLALAQGFEPRHPGERRIGRAVEGVGGFVDLVALGRRREL